MSKYKTNEKLENVSGGAVLPLSEDPKDGSKAYVVDYKESSPFISTESLKTKTQFLGWFSSVIKARDEGKNWCFINMKQFVCVRKADE